MIGPVPDDTRALALPELGLRANASQFALLVLVNVFVGATIGLERSILPAIAEHEFGVVARTAMLSFIVVFGIRRRSPTTWQEVCPTASAGRPCSSRDGGSPFRSRSS